MSELWEHRLPVLLAFALALAAVFAMYGLPAAFGVGMACLLGYSYGLYERDRHPSSPSSEPPPAARA